MTILRSALASAAVILALGSAAASAAPLAGSGRVAADTTASAHLFAVRDDAPGLTDGLRNLRDQRDAERGYTREEKKAREKAEKERQKAEKAAEKERKKAEEQAERCRLRQQRDPNDDCKQNIVPMKP